jgi:aryl-alcohol dehydrogenase-like predicted oxidoreductase
VNLSNKLSLGTVQFGLDYGVANHQGQIPDNEAQSILTEARTNGMDMLDTAIAYGDSEQRLGELGIENWKVVSKLSDIPDGCNDIFKWVEDSVNESLHRLNIKCLYGLLLHRPQQLLEKNGVKLFNALQKIKKSGLVQKIGISIYDPIELDELCNSFQLDIVQAPFNLLDRRLIDSGWMSRLNKKKIELHVRSVFLQGLLLMKSNERPQKFSRWDKLWSEWEQWLQQIGLTPLQACLRYTLSFEDIKNVIVGVDNEIQLKEIIEAVKGPIPQLPTVFKTDDLRLLNPACWNQL